jgi:hypothetical protein
MTGAGIAQSVWRWAMGWAAQVRFPAVTDYSLILSVQTESGAHPAYPMGAGALSPGVKRPGRETDHSPPSNAEVKRWSYTSTPPYVIMGECLTN